MATQAERINAMEASLAAIMAAVTGGNAPTVEPEDDETPVKSAKGGNAAKGATLKIPSHTVTDDDGNRYRFTQAYQSSPKNGDPVIYRTPRVLIETKGPNDDDFRKLTTVLPSVLAAIQSIPTAKSAAFMVDAREA